MAKDHPFQNLFEMLGQLPAAHAESVNRQAYQILSEALSGTVDKVGRGILLRAPRAGHGKSHLLARTQHALGADYEFIAVTVSFDGLITPTSLMEDVLQHFSRPAAGGNDLSELDMVTRRLFASALQPLVISGDVPCQDKEGALAALRQRPIEAFDFHHPEAITAHWARENFEILGERLSAELARRINSSVVDVAFWVKLLFRFASAPAGESARFYVFKEVHGGGSGAEMKRLIALLELLTLLTRIVLVADEVESFSRNQTAAMNFSSFLSSLRQAVSRLELIVSLNRDVWETAFEPNLSGGLVDRLTEVVIDLKPLTEAEMVALLDSRVPGAGTQILAKIDPVSPQSYARALIQAAGKAWQEADPLEFKPLAFTTIAAEKPTPPPIPEPITEPKIEVKAEPKAEVELEPEPKNKPLPQVEPVRKIAPPPINLTPKAKTEPEPTAESSPPKDEAPTPPPFKIKFPGITPKAPIQAATPPKDVKFSPFVPVNVAEIIKDQSAAPPVVVRPPVPQSQTDEEDFGKSDDLESLEAKTSINSPFSIAESENALAEDAASPKQPSVPEETSKLDRVADLIRQFSERYGSKRL
jgi:hypothetical protein